MYSPIYYRYYRQSLFLKINQTISKCIFYFNITYTVTTVLYSCIHAYMTVHCRYL